MKDITLENYEAYLLDYIEGRLSDAEKADLLAFLELHPDCHQDLEEFESIFLPSDALILPEKELLKKTALDFVSEEVLIGHIEGLLPEKQVNELQQKAKEHPEIAQEIQRYQATRLQPEWALVYPDKEGLKKENKLIYFNLRTVAYVAAAGLALVAGLWLLNPNGASTSEIKPLAGNYPKAVASQHSQRSEHGNSSLPTTTEPSSLAPAPSTISPIDKSQAQSPAAAGRQTPLTKVASKAAAPNKNKAAANEAAVLAANTPDTTSKSSSVDGEWKQKFDATTVLTLSEEEAQDSMELPVSGRKRKSIWAIAQKTLNRLNQAGMKGVDGEEKDSEQTVAYDLTIGDVSVKHSYANPVTN